MSDSSMLLMIGMVMGFGMGVMFTSVIAPAGKWRGLVAFLVGFAIICSALIIFTVWKVHS